MSFILVPQHGEQVRVNAWNRRPTLELLSCEHIIGLEQYERMGANGCGGRVDRELAPRIAETIEGKLRRMKPGERVLADGTVTDQLREKAMFGQQAGRREMDVNDLYSAEFEWLERFRDFCRESGGFLVS